MEFTSNDDVFRIQFDTVATRMHRILTDDKHVVTWCEEQVNATLSDIHQQPDINV
jgi:hypothetical protein